MANILCADCGFNPVPGAEKAINKRDEFVEVASSVVKAAGGWDVSKSNNYIVDLSDEAADISIASIEGAIDGRVYKLIATNAAAKKLQVTFPSGTKYQGTITPANAMIVVYEFFTDGTTMYCRRAIFA